MQIDRKELDDQTVALKDKTKFASDTVCLDVGGKRMTVALDTLCSVEGSALQKMFSGTHDLKRTRDGLAYFLDRDYDAFNNMVNYLRNKREVFPEMKSESQIQLFEQELEYWQLKTTNAPLEEKRIRSKLNKDLVAFFDS